MSDDAVTKAAKEAAERLRLEITHVWVLELIEPYDTSEVLGVYVDVLAAKQGRTWTLCGDNESWTTDTGPGRGPYYLLGRYPLTH